MADTLKYKDYQTPFYNVIKTEDNIEIREYDDFNIITNTAEEDGFMDLFKYIGGENEGKIKMDMTVPVLTDKANKTEKFMSFVVPNEFALKDIPKPDNKNIVISHLALKKVLAIKFSGFVSESNFAKHKDILLEYAQKNNIKINQEKVISLIYDRPFTLPFNRRNEIIVQIIK